MQNNPWDKHLRPETEQTFQAHGLEFVITTDGQRSSGEPDGRAVFSRREVQMLKLTAGGKIPKDLSVALHLVKSTLGGEIESCTLDPKLFQRQ